MTPLVYIGDLFAALRPRPQIGPGRRSVATLHRAEAQRLARIRQGKASPAELRAEAVIQKRRAVWGGK